jgi:ABC-type thiamine transport system ATPase subunit
MTICSTRFLAIAACATHSKATYTLIQTHGQRARCVVILCISQRLSDLQRVTNRAVVLQAGRRNSDLNSRNLASAQRKSRINPDI